MPPGAFRREHETRIRVNTIDALGAIGEVLSWLGFGIGLPALALGLLLRAGDGRWLPVEAVLVEDGAVAAGRRVRVRWYAGDDFHERTLRPEELRLWRGRETVRAYASERRPERLRPERLRPEPRRPLAHALTLAGLTLTAVGVVAAALSFLPLLAA
ncbi:hypothetical protein B4915_00735 [Leucobacter massiliensis]|uniref:DUF3592 domain-containing protein n=1 Tax=Leucobacter massiliensis TaxID=1686285 RepID=A0A2S9QSP9_9MICO|nr:hypothetical protein B4915_00735 [Leucobacter massiliensis]